jgi:NADPH-dependent curcumin reductase
MKKRIKLQGFIVPDFIPQHAGRFFAEVPALLGEGKITSKELITEGIKNAPQAIVDMMSGHDAPGKPVIIVAKE